MFLMGMAAGLFLGATAGFLVSCLMVATSASEADLAEKIAFSRSAAFSLDCDRRSGNDGSGADKVGQKLVSSTKRR